MAIGVTDDHVELQRTIGKFAGEQLGGRAREALDLDGEPDDTTLAELTEMGLVAMHVAPEFGGEQASFVELALVIEELGKVVAPGGFLTTTTALDLIQRGMDESEARPIVEAVLGGAAKITTAFVTRTPSPVVGTESNDGGLTLTGTFPAVLNGRHASFLVAPVVVGGREEMVVVDLAGVARQEVPGIDPTRRVTTITLEGCSIPAAHRLARLPVALARSVGITLASAELTGGARASLEIARDHAQTRIQFGRPIGQFQAIKHRLADLLLAVEQMTAATWDAALSIDHVELDDARSLREVELCAEASGSLCLEGGVRAAKDAIQVLGGMGFTWEHDAHLYLRRATVLRSLLGPAFRSRQRVTELAVAGARRELGIDLPDEAATMRADLERTVGEIAAAPEEQRTSLLGEKGLLFPHWPEPYGLGAGPVQQLVVDQLLSEHGLRRPPANVMAWALPTLIAHGTVAQQERFVLPTLRGEIMWCQLFSEPGAGSDLASLSTKGEKVEGGWKINGQKVWTSVAKWAHYGILLARTNPEAPKHKGISYFVVDMKAPGIDIRPLREITGDALFNEVFFDDVFVPDDALVGDVDDGWKLARTTLSNERVALAGSSAFGTALETVLDVVASQPADPTTYEALGALLVDAQSLSQMRQRALLRSVFGLEPGSEASLAKLLGAEHDQAVADFGVELLGPAGVLADEGPAALFARQMLHTLCLTIAGGTSEVQRNVIGERLLGLPRDPEPATK